MDPKNGAETPEQEDVPPASETPPTDAQPDDPEGEGVAFVDDADTHAALIARLQAQNQALEARLRTVSAAYKEQQDDMRATRERLERQAQAKEELRRGEVVSTLFEPFQNLRRSIGSVRSGASAQEVAKGLEIVEHQVMEAFGRLGLEEVPGKGARFDPSLHEAISTVPVTDPALDDVVLEVFSAGYRIGNRLIQPARVVIGRMPEPVREPADETPSRPDDEERTEGEA